MNEDFLHYIWKFKRLATSNFTCTSNQQVTIEEFGIHNMFSGPDFKNAKVRIGNLLHVGHVEMHINSSDWYKHKHDLDRNYDNVVLHVVYNHDQEIIVNERLLPTIELKRYALEPIETKFKKKFLEEDISCKNQLKELNELLWRSQLDSMLVSRLTRRLNENIELLSLLNGDYNKLLDVLIGRTLGGPVNKEGFELLVETYPSNITSKIEQNEESYKQLFLGLAGFELNPEDVTTFNYWNYYSSIYDVSQITNRIWKYGRLMPKGFPYVRVKQFANIQRLKKEIMLSINDRLDFRQWMKLIQSNNKFNKDREGDISPSMSQKVIINAILPFIDVLKYRKTGELNLDYHIQLLEEIPSEKNHIAKKWKENGVRINNAGESQGLIELYNEYCVKKQCLNCKFGVTFMAR